ncbi:MAG: fatty acid hydroxylase [Caulobacterales bacterium 32-69-10]|nr:MAG: fatty acid hydroxylase [Caulobacterales bacterium 32-69-10]
MLRDLFVTTVALSLIIGVRYLIVAIVAHHLLWSRAGRGRRLNRAAPAWPRVRSEIIASLIACPIYALPAAAVLELWKRGGTAIYSDPERWPLWWLAGSFVTYLLAHDAFYYWLHRLLHHPRIFPWAHAEHHRSRDPSAFASFAFDPAEALATAWFLPAMAMVVPIHWGVALGLLTLMTATAVLNHAGREVWPERWLSSAPLRWFITATHHDAHHKRFNGNYGLYLQFWDEAGRTSLPPQTNPSPQGGGEGPSRSGVPHGGRAGGLAGGRGGRIRGRD